MLETTARGLNPWAEQGCDSQRSLFCALLMLGIPPVGCWLQDRAGFSPKFLSLFHC